MEEKQERFISRNRYYLVLLLFMGLLFIGALYNNRGWDDAKKNECLGWSINSKEDLMNGYLCIYNESKCTLIERGNTKIKTCICQRNNKTFILYCDTKADIKLYNKGYKASDKDIHDAETLLEKQTNISLNEYFNRNKTEGGK